MGKRGLFATFRGAVSRATIGNVNHLTPRVLYSEDNCIPSNNFWQCFSELIILCKKIATCKSEGVILTFSFFCQWQIMIDVQFQLATFLKVTNTF